MKYILSKESCKILKKKGLEDEIVLQKEKDIITKVNCWFINRNKNCRQNNKECRYHPLYF